MSLFLFIYVAYVIWGLLFLWKKYLKCCHSLGQPIAAVTVLIYLHVSTVYLRVYAFTEFVMYCSLIIIHRQLWNYCSELAHVHCLLRGRFSCWTKWNLLKPYQQWHNTCNLSFFCIGYRDYYHSSSSVSGGCLFLDTVCLVEIDWSLNN